MEKSPTPLPTIHPIEPQLVIIVLLAILGLVFFGFVLVVQIKLHRFDKASQPSMVNPVLSENTLPLPTVETPSPSAVSTMTPYSNSIFGVSFSYPDNWILEDTHIPKNKLISSIIVTVHTGENRYREEKPYLVASFSITAIKKSAYSMDALIKKYPSDFGGLDPIVSERTIGTITGTQIEVKGTIGNTDRRVFFFQKDELIYEVDSVWVSGSQESDDALKAILDTFTLL